MARGLTLGLALLPPALSQELYLAPATTESAAEVRLIDARPGDRALLVDRTTTEGLVRADGLPQGRVIAVREVDARGEARFELPSTAFRARAPLAVVVAGPSGRATVGQLTLPAQVPVLPPRWARSVLAQTRDVLVTEFMKDPAAVSDVRGEWIEFYNPRLTPIDIEGWTLSDYGNDSTVLTNSGSGIIIAPMGLIVLARNGDPMLNGGVNPVATYNGMALANGADQILLSRPDGTLVDAVLYEDGPTWPDRSGASVSLSPRAWRTGHDDVALAWCEGESVMWAGDLGTPALFNDTCWD